MIVFHRKLNFDAEISERVEFGKTDSALQRTLRVLSSTIFYRREVARLENH